MRVLAIGWRGTADERGVGAQRPKPCKLVQALARVACAVPPALLARGGTGYATRAPSVQRVYIGGVCKQARILPLLRSRRCSTPAAVRRTVLASFLLHSWLLVGNMEAYPVQSADMRERQAFQPQPEAVIDQPEASCGSQQQQ